MKKKAAKTVIFIFILTLLGKAFGFLKSMMIASYYGADNVTDAYYLSDGIVSNAFYMITMSISIAFLPLYIKVKEENGQQAAKQFASRVLVNMTIISGAFTVLFVLIAPIIIKIAAFSYEGSQFQLAVLFLRIMSLGIVFSLITNILQNLMNAEEIYGYVSFSSILNSLVMIFAMLLFHNHIGILALVIATPASYIIQYIFLKLRSRRFVKFTFKYGMKDSNFLFLCKQAIPIFLSNATIEINQMIDRMLLISIAEGAVTAIAYAGVLFQFAALIISMPLNTVAFTKIAQASAQNDKLQIQLLLQRVLRLIVLLSLPIVVIMFLFPNIIVTIIYGRGEYDLVAIAQTAEGLKYYAFCVIPFCIKKVITNAFCSVEDNKTPMKMSILEVCLNIMSSIVLAYCFGVKGVVMGTAVASTVFALVLIWLFHKKVVPLDLKKEKYEYIKIFFATVIVVMLDLLIKKMMVFESPVIQFGIYVFLSLTVYILILIIFKESIVCDILYRIPKNK